jgi:hypothetical protein
MRRASACRRRGPRRERRGLRCHREQMARLAVERDGAGAVRRPGLQVLLDVEARRTFFLDDGHRAVALRGERFHRCRVERRAIGTAGEWQPCEDLPISRTQDDKRLRRLGIGIGRRWRLSGRSPRRARADGVARREQDLILRVEREPIAPGVVTEWIGRRHLHRFGVHHRDASRPVLEDLVDGALAVGDGLLRRAAEVDVSEHRPILGVNHKQALRRMAADIDAIVGGIAIDTIRAEPRRNFDRLDQLHRLDVEHRRLRMIAREAVARVRTHRRAVAAHARNHAD